MTKALVVLSGGLDSTISLRWAVEEYGNENVTALSFNYGQMQKVELQYAKRSTNRLNVEHDVMKLSFFGPKLTSGCATMDEDVEMPGLLQILGEKSPVTYIPNRNMILLSIAASYAETNGMNYIVTGIRDSAPYHDTSPSFINKMNLVLDENPKVKIRIQCPFMFDTKESELLYLKALDGNLDFIKHSFSCYRPNEQGMACGKCPPCEDRLGTLKRMNETDRIPYVNGNL